MRVMSLFITPKDIETPVTVFHFSEKLEFTVNANVYGEPSELINMDFKFKILNNDDFSLDQHFSSEGMQLSVEHQGKRVEFTLGDITGEMHFDIEDLPDQGIMEISAISNENILTTYISFFKEV